MVSDLTGKICSKCKEEKDISFFPKNKSKPSGVNSRCKECTIADQKSYYQRNSDKVKRKVKEYAKKNKEKVSAYNRTKTRDKEYDKRYYLENKEKVKQTQRAYYEKKKLEYFERNARRRAAKLTSQPSWLTEEQKEQIQNFYWLCQDLKVVTGQDYHVDHILPLQGETVCGLHVPWNLQVLPSDINISKSNRTPKW
jgi:actin-related protein